MKNTLLCAVGNFYLPGVFLTGKRMCNGANACFYAVFAKKLNKQMFVENFHEMPKTAEKSRFSSYLLLKLPQLYDRMKSSIQRSAQNTLSVGGERERVF